MTLDRLPACDGFAIVACGDAGMTLLKNGVAYREQQTPNRRTVELGAFFTRGATTWKSPCGITQLPNSVINRLSLLKLLGYGPAKCRSRT
jgi:hypothetical protein